jgi:hypothetical protein
VDSLGIMGIPSGYRPFSINLQEANQMNAFIPGAPFTAYCVLVNVTRVATTDACYLSGLAHYQSRFHALSLDDFHLSMYNHLQQHRPSCRFSKAV